MSLGFKSGLSEFDVLFVVCGRRLKEQDRARGTSGLYFERFDQLYSCDGAAELISVGSEWVDVDFDAEGGRELKFPARVRFDCRSARGNPSELRRVFAAMSVYEWGRVVSVD